MIAVSGGYNEVVSILLDAPNIEVNKRDDNGVTALWLACGRGYEKMVEVLVKKGADLNMGPNGLSPLMAASCEVCFLMTPSYHPNYC